MTGAATGVERGPGPLTRQWWRARGAGPAYWVLAVLLVVGVAIRIVAVTSWWPAITTLADSWPYAAYANGDPLADPQHPAGYPAMLAVIGFVSQELAVPILIQHLLGIASAFVLFAAVRRITGSPWPGLAPAAVVLLSADQIFLEHTIMSEGPFLAVMAGGAYASVRAVEAPDPLWRWPAAAGALIGLAAVFRSAAIFFLPVAALAVLLARPRPWRPQWRGPVAVLGVGVILLGVYALANLSANGRLEVGPTQGWHLYGRVGSFADCGQFTPPPGTRRLCDRPPRPSVRGATSTSRPGSPALRAYGEQPWKKHDGDMGAFDGRPSSISRRPMPRRSGGTFARTSSQRPGNTGLGPEVTSTHSWTGPRQVRVTPGRSEPLVRDAGVLQSLPDDEGQWRPQLYDDYQRIFRFGATLLSLTTLLTLLGLVVGLGGAGSACCCSGSAASPCWPPPHSRSITQAGTQSRSLR